MRLPPIAAAKTKGINNLEREYPDFAAIPITTGIRIAAVPVFERVRGFMIKAKRKTNLTNEEVER